MIIEVRALDIMLLNVNKQESNVGGTHDVNRPRITRYLIGAANSNDNDFRFKVFGLVIGDSCLTKIHTHA